MWRSLVLAPAPMIPTLNGNEKKAALERRQRKRCCGAPAARRDNPAVPFQALSFPRQHSTLVSANWPVSVDLPHDCFGGDLVPLAHGARSDLTCPRCR